MLLPTPDSLSVPHLYPCRVGHNVVGLASPRLAVYLIFISPASNNHADYRTHAAGPWLAVHASPRTRGSNLIWRGTVGLRLVLIYLPVYLPTSLLAPYRGQRATSERLCPPMTLPLLHDPHEASSDTRAPSTQQACGEKALSDKCWPAAG